MATKIRFSKWLIAPLLVLLIGGGIAGGLWHKNRGHKAIPATSTAAQDPERIDYSPATKEDQARADQHKDDLVKQEQQNQASSGPKTVTPIIISASATSVKGFVPGIYESGGTCEAVFTKGSEKVSKQSAAVKGATTTDCTPIVLARSDFPSSGEWTVVLSYNSANAHGSSASQKVTVN